MNLNFRQIVSKLPPRGWAAVGGALIVGIIFVYVLFSMASSPSYSTVAAGVSPAQAGKITSALSTAGIPYQLANNGTAVSVESGKESQARVVLDEQGLLDGTGGTSSLENYLGKESLGESDFQQEQQDTSAIEEQLEEEIESMNGINSAQVVLAVPDEADDLFTATNTSPTGSVLLNTDSDLGSSAAKSIAEMVSGAVTGLSSDKVTITDQDGDVLWPNGSGAGTASSTSKEAAQQNYDQTEAAKADALLESTIGPGKAIVEVSGDLDTNKQTIDSVTYGPKGTALTSDTSNEKLTGTGASTAAAAGNTSTEDAASYAGTDGSGDGNYTDKTNKSTYGVDKTVSESTVAPGAVNSQSISVLLNKDVPASEIPTIKAAVENAVGFKTGRDTISVGTVPFAKVTPAAASGGAAKMIGYVKYLAFGLAALVFLLFTTRMLRRREGEVFAKQPTWLRELEVPRPLAALDGGGLVDLEAPQAAVARLRSPVSPARQQVEDLVDREPERVASQLRQWMTED